MESMLIGRSVHTNGKLQAHQLLLQDCVRRLHHSVYIRGFFYCVNTCKCLPGLRGFQAVSWCKKHFVTN